MIKCFMTQSDWYKNAVRNGTPVGILWHDTAAGNPNLCRYVQPDDNAPDKDELIGILGKNRYNNDWNHSSRDAGLNAWIGKRADGVVDVVQVGEWDIHAWGCGGGNKGSCNGYVKNNGKTTWVSPFWIQFEICDDGYKDEAYFNEAYKKAVEFTAFICKTFGIDPMGKVSFNGVDVPTILCHADSYKLGLGSNHGDVYKWFNKFGKTMDDVRKDVKEILDGEKHKIVCPYCGKTIYIDDTPVEEEKPVDPEPPVDPYWYYTVLNRDTLWGIALKWYGKGTLWKTIYEDNTDVIKNPNVIYGGMVLKMRKDMTKDR